jgi:hypothetical protein
MTIHYRSPVQRSLELGTLKDLARWRAANGDQYSLLDYLYGNANLELATAFTALFWPDTVEHEQGVFLKDRFSVSRFSEWSAACAGDMHDVQVSMNRIVLHDLMPGVEDMSDGNLGYLQSTVAGMWDARLHRLHPLREFSVYCFEVDLGPALSFAVQPQLGAFE